VQAEKSDADGSLYGMFGWAQNSYTDHFKADSVGNELQATSGNISGYQLKGGINRNVSDQWSVFGNAGYVSKVPIVDGVINDVTATLNPSPKNETFTSFEAGVNYRSLDRGIDLSLNVYHTTWKNQTKTLYVPNDEIQANVLGVNERHMGVELQPQTQLAYAVSVFPVEGLYLDLQGRSSTRYFAAFDPFGRTDPTDHAQSWQVPGSTEVDFHGSYRLNDLIPAWKGGDVRLFANVFNLFDALYIQDATDDSSYNGFKADGQHDASSAEVYLGGPRTFSIGFQLIF